MKKRKGVYFILFLVLLSPIILKSEVNGKMIEPLNNVEIKGSIEEYLDFSNWGWTTTEVITTESSDASVNPSIEVDGMGNIHVIWVDHTDFSSGTDLDIFYKYWNVSSKSWSSIEEVSTESTEDSKFPSLAVDSSGNVFVTWNDLTDYSSAGNDYDIFFKKRNFTTGLWTTTEVISTISADGSYLGKIAVDSLGNIYIVWQDFTDYLSAGTDFDVFYRKWSSSSETWSTVEVLSTDSTSASEHPYIEIDSFNNIHVVWHDQTNYLSSGSDADIFYKKLDFNLDSWLTTEVVSTESIGGSLYPTMVVDVVGGVHVVWRDNSDYAGSGSDADVFYKNRLTSNVWTTTEVVSAQSDAAVDYPTIVVDSFGGVHVAWEDLSNYAGAGADSDIFYRYKEPFFDSWIITEVASTVSDLSSNWPVLSIDSDDRIYLVWHDHTNYDSSGSDQDLFVQKLMAPPRSPELAFIQPNPTEYGDIYLSWNNINDAEMFYIYRSTSYIWSLEGLSVLNSTVDNYYLDSVSGGIYYYVVVAGNEIGNSTISNCQYVEVKFSDLGVPILAPILSNPSDSGDITLEWNGVDGATEYFVYRSTSYIWSEESLTSIASTSSTFYDDTLPSEGSYFYAIVASDGTRNSTNSNCEHIEVKFPDLDSPKLALILPNPSNSSNITLEWNSIDGATEYYIYRSTSYIWSVEELTPIAIIISNYYNDTLPSGGSYFYIIVASDGIRNSSISNCEYVEYIPLIEKSGSMSGLILGIFVLSLIAVKICKKKLKRN